MRFVCRLRYTEAYALFHQFTFGEGTQVEANHQALHPETNRLDDVILIRGWGHVASFLIMALLLTWPAAITLA